MSYSFTKLKIGALVEMSFVNEKNVNIKLKTIVENINNNKELVLFAPVLKGVNYPLRTNQGFNLIMVNKHPQYEQYDIYSCRCKIIERMQTENISTIRILQTEEIIQVQRRDYFRLPLIKNMTFLSDNKVHQLLSKDLSGNGIRGYVSIKLVAGAECILYLDIGDEKLSLRFKVVDCDPDPESSRRYILRANFLQIKSAQRSKLIKYIYSKQSETIRKQIDFKSSSSLINSYQSYGDYFDMPTKEKIARLSPVVLWGLTIVNMAYFSLAFKNLNMGLNRFFKEFRPTFRPQFLDVSASISVIILLASLIGMNYNESYNKRTRSRVRLHILAVMTISIVILVISLILGR